MSKANEALLALYSTRLYRARIGHMLLAKMSKRNRVNYVSDEPAFIRQFKQRVGYKEGPSVDTKRQKLEYEEDDRSDTEEEKPVVVVLKAGDLTAEEASEEDKLKKQIEEEAAIRDGKITFKKPEKKGEANPANTSSTQDMAESVKDKGKHRHKKKKEKEKKKSSLLSFDDEEEEDG